MQRTLDILKILVFAAFFALLIHIFFLSPYWVEDNGMLPRYRKGDIILINRLPSYSQVYKRGDVVIFRDANDYSRAFIRRIIGLPGERIIINDGILRIYGTDKIIDELPVFGNVSSSLQDIGALDAHEYFVLGDSDHENNVGLIDRRFILGKPLAL